MGRVTTVSFFLPAAQGKVAHPTQLPFRLHKGLKRIVAMTQAVFPTYDIAM
jgi:hypothetical protein